MNEPPSYQIVQKERLGDKIFYTVIEEYQLWFYKKGTRILQNVFWDYGVKVPAGAVKSTIYSDTNLERARSLFQELKRKGIPRLTLVHARTWEPVD